MAMNTEGRERRFCSSVKCLRQLSLVETRLESRVPLFGPVNLKIPFDPGLLCRQFGLNHNRILERLCTSLDLFSDLKDNLIWAWRRIWVVNSVFQMPLLDQPSVSTE